MKGPVGKIRAESPAPRMPVGTFRQKNFVPRVINLAGLHRAEKPVSGEEEPYRPWSRRNADWKTEEVLTTNTPTDEKFEHTSDLVKRMERLKNPMMVNHIALGLAGIATKPTVTLPIRQMAVKALRRNKAKIPAWKIIKQMLDKKGPKTG